jgi:ABC-type uncharacterized transport system substrate-binding protein
MAKRTWEKMGLIVLIFAVLVSAGCGKRFKKIFYINSYHEGYAPSDEKMTAVQETIASRSDVVLKIFFMDRQRLKDDKSLQAKIAEALKAIRDFNPDVIIASDDDAVKYIIAPNFRKGPIPVVFCGVYWSCHQYGLPTAFVTGMLEVLPVKESLELLRKTYPEMKKITVLSGNSSPDRKNIKILETLFREEGLVTETDLVDNFDSWKQFFAAANKNSDVVFLPSNGAISGWKDTEAWEFMYKNIRKPTFTCDESMMRFAVFGMTKVEREQGEWAAKTALAILADKKPSDFPVAVNRQTRGYINPILADVIEFKPEAGLLEKLEKVR